MSDDNFAGAPSDLNAATTATGSVAERIDPNKKLASNCAKTTTRRGGGGARGLSQMTHCAMNRM